MLSQVRRQFEAHCRSFEARIRQKASRAVAMWRGVAMQAYATTKASTGNSGFGQPSISPDPHTSGVPNDFGHAYEMAEGKLIAIIYGVIILLVFDFSDSSVRKKD